MSGEHQDRIDICDERRAEPCKPSRAPERAHAADLQDGVQGTRDRVYNTCERSVGHWPLYQPMHSFKDIPAPARASRSNLKAPPRSKSPGRRVSPSDARAWSSWLYSTTDGHASKPLTSEVPIAQPLSQIVTKTRATRRHLEHPPLCVMSSLHGLELLGHPQQMGLTSKATSIARNYLLIVQSRMIT